MLSEFYIPGALEAAQTLEELDDALLVLRFDLGKLEAAWGRAFAPINARVVPMLDTAVRAVTDFVNAAGQVIAALFGGVQVKAAKTVKVTGSAVKRALADFDQLDRMPGGSGGSSSYTVPAELVAIPEQYIAIAQRIRAIWQELTDTLHRLLAPLRAIDFSAAAAAFAALYQALTPFVRGLFAGLEWAWFNLLTPMAQWGAEQALPAFLETLASLLNALQAAIAAARPLLSWLWNELLVPMGKWAGQTLLNGLRDLSLKLGVLAQWFNTLSPLAQIVTAGLSNLKDGFTALCTAMGLWNTRSSGFATGLSLLRQLGHSLATAFYTVSTALGYVMTQLSNLLSALQPACRGAMNAVAGVVNSVLAGIQSAVNAMITALNGLKISIPDWVPGVGGRQFGMHFDYVQLPRVPALARGAVLPANKPFLAVVGDQKSGTNVEAPLSVIQEAVAAVLERNAGAQQDTNRLLAAILTAVDGIEVGDDTIGRAARRYENRMAVMGGVI